MTAPPPPTPTPVRGRRGGGERKRKKISNQYPIKGINLFCVSKKKTKKKNISSIYTNISM